jgi:hypothetical protein
MQRAVLDLILKHKLMGESTRRDSLVSKIASPAKSLKNVAKEKLASVKNEEASFDKRFSPLMAGSSSASFSFRKKSAAPPEAELDRNALNAGLKQARYEDLLSNEKFAILEWALLIEDLAKEKEKNAESLSPETQYYYACYLHHAWSTAWEAERKNLENLSEMERKKYFAERILTQLDLSAPPLEQDIFHLEPVRIMAVVEDKFSQESTLLEDNTLILDGLSVELGGLEQAYSTLKRDLPSWPEQITWARLLKESMMVSARVSTIISGMNLFDEKIVNKIDLQSIKFEVLHDLPAILESIPDQGRAYLQKLTNALFLSKMMVKIMALENQASNDEVNSFVRDLATQEFPLSFEYKTRELFESEEAALGQFIYRRMAEKFQGSSLNPSEFMMKTLGRTDLGEPHEVKALPEDKIKYLKGRVEADFNRYENLRLGDEIIGENQYDAFVNYLSKKNISPVVKEAALSQLTQSASLWSGGVDLIKNILLEKDQRNRGSYVIGLSNEGIQTALSIASADDGAVCVDCSVTLKVITYMPPGAFEPINMELPSIPMEYQLIITEKNGKANLQVRVKNWESFEHLMTGMAAKVREQIAHLPDIPLVIEPHQPPTRSPKL